MRLVRWTVYAKRLPVPPVHPTAQFSQTDGTLGKRKETERKIRVACEETRAHRKSVAVAATQPPRRQHRRSPMRYYALSDSSSCVVGKTAVGRERGASLLSVASTTGSGINARVNQKRHVAPHVEYLTG